MGIYNNALEIGSSLEKWKLPIAGIVIVILLLVAGFYLFRAAQPTELSASFSPNVLETSKAPAIVSMGVRVNNTLRQDIQHITITVKAVDESIQLFPESREIPVIEQGSFRELKGDSGFLVKPNPLQKPLPGRYTIQINATIDGRQYKYSEVQLEVK